jgi:hypothetical protein
VKPSGEGYQAKVLRLVAEGKLIVQPGSWSDVYIEHHDRCPFHAGRACRCDPDIRVVQRGAA